MQVRVEYFAVHKCMQSFSYKEALTLAKTGLNRIIFRRVADIEDRHDVVVGIERFDIFAFVHIQLIHKQGKLHVAILLA